MIDLAGVFMSKPHASKRAFAYGRFSSEVQKGGTSEERQDRIIEKYAENEGLEIVEWYFDEAKSGYRGRHLKGEFGRLMADIRAGKKIKPGDCLIIEDFSRFSRQELVQAQFLFYEILNAEIDIATARRTPGNPPQRYSKKD